MGYSWAREVYASRAQEYPIQVAHLCFYWLRNPWRQIRRFRLIAERALLYQPLIEPGVKRVYSFALERGKCL